MGLGKSVDWNHWRECRWEDENESNSSDVFCSRQTLVCNRRANLRSLSEFISNSSKIRLHLSINENVLFVS